MKLLSARQAFTLVEMLIGGAIGTSIMACLIVGSITLQRGYSAAEHQIRSQTDQMRIVDYITRDVRRAAHVETENGGTKLVVTLPNLVGEPTIVGDGTVQYGTGTPQVKISYYIEGDTFIRQEDSRRLAIATRRVEHFTATVAWPVVNFELTFMPKSFRASASTQRLVELSTSAFVRNADRRLK